MLHTSQLQVLAEIVAVEEAEGVDEARLAEGEAVEPEGDEEAAWGGGSEAWVVGGTKNTQLSKFNGCPI